jgi:hypothetical protein
MMPNMFAMITALGARRALGHHLRRAAARTVMLGSLVAMALGMVLIPKAEAGPRRPIIFVPGTMATSFNGPSSPDNPDVARVWLDANWNTPWDLVDDDEVRAHFRLKHLPGSTSTDVSMTRESGRNVSYIGTAAWGYWDGLIDFDIPSWTGGRIHEDLRKALEDYGYVKNVNLFALRYDWVQDWDLACQRLDSLVTEALNKSGADKVFLMGHSQGTQVIDACLIDYKPGLQARTAGVIHFGPPNHGGNALKTYGNMTKNAPGEKLTLGTFAGINVASISASTARAITERSPALYAMRPDSVYEFYLEEQFPWIVGSYAEFQDSWRMVRPPTLLPPPQPAIPPVYELVTRALTVPSGANLSNQKRAEEFTAQLKDATLAQWSANKKNNWNKFDNRYNLPQLVVRGTGHSTPAQYSVHFNTYDRVDPCCPMPARGSSVVYDTGDKTVQRLGTWPTRSKGSVTIHTYMSNFSSTEDCEDNEHNGMFKGACAWDKVDLVYDWINSIGRTTPDATTADMQANALQAGEREFVYGEGSLLAHHKETTYRNLSFFAPIKGKVLRSATAETALATLTLPTSEGALYISVGRDGDIREVYDARGMHKDLATAESHRVYTELVPSTVRGINMVHIFVQVPMAGNTALANVGTTVDFDPGADNVVLITADVSASTGKRTGQKVEFASRSTEGPTLQQVSLSFHVDSAGALTRR